MNLKPYTKYFCPDCGKSSIWTGALTAYRDGDGICSVCRTPMVEDVPDGRWRLSWEHISPMVHPDLYDWRTERARQDVNRDRLPEAFWQPVSNETTSEYDARQQHDGLLELQAAGEFIRNVKLEHAPESEWREVAS